MKKLTRRDTLKLAASLSLGLVLSDAVPQIRLAQSLHPNVLIIVLDALTARNMSLYGYPRNTTPNIERFAKRATIYHSHYSAGTFTTSGTASLLTGMYPWTHRATSIAGLVRGKYANRNIFNLIGRSYQRIAFTQNINADILLREFGDQLDEHLPLSAFSEMNQYIAGGTGRDLLVKYRAYDGFLFANRPGSLFGGAINKYHEEYAAAGMQEQIDKHELQYFERDLFYKIDKIFAGIQKQVEDSASPFFSYFHLYPPHEPYVPGIGFDQLFNDDWEPTTKNRHNLLVNWDSRRQLRERRLLYDQYLATVDFAFGQFIDALERKRILDNTYIILTSDHGQMFERGLEGHVSPLVYESAIHIPLLIMPPKSQSRQDVRSATSNIDLLPTLLQFGDSALPDWCEGHLLPCFGGVEDFDRPIYSMDAKDSPANGNLSTISIALRRGRYKLIYYTGYSAYRTYPEDLSYNRGVFELYDLEADPEELSNIIGDVPSVAQPLQDELLDTYNTFGGRPK